MLSKILSSFLTTTFLVSTSLAASLDKSGIVPVVPVAPENNTQVPNPVPVVTQSNTINDVVCETPVLGEKENSYLLHWLFGNNTTTKECLYGDRDSGNDAIQEGPSLNNGRPGRDEDEGHDEDEGKDDDNNNGDNDNDTGNSSSSSVSLTINTIVAYTGAESNYISADITSLKIKI